MKALDLKLARIREGSYRPDDFILADAKDGDMALGLAAPGPLRLEGRGPPAPPFKGRTAHLEAMTEMVRQGAVDILLASASNAEWLGGHGLFEGSSVTLALRANDASDIWRPRGSSYAREPSRPFSSVNLEAVRSFCDLGLYSLTFNNDLERDLESLERYAGFRSQARRLGFRHFLEVFDPNAPSNLLPEALPSFVNDSIVRALAGLTGSERPLFLKIAYHGRRALEELASYDPALVVGILGGPAGTSRDAYELVAQASRSGARVALLGRKINLAESPLDLVALLRPVIRGDLRPEEAVRAYHGKLQEKGLRPRRTLEEDLAVTEPALQHG